MPASLKPIKRLWKPKAPVPARTKFDAYGSELPEVDMQEKNAASVSATFEEMQGDEAAKGFWGVVACLANLVPYIGSMMNGTYFVSQS